SGNDDLGVGKRRAAAVGDRAGDSVGRGEVTDRVEYLDVVLRRYSQVRHEHRRARLAGQGVHDARDTVPEFLDLKRAQSLDTSAVDLAQDEVLGYLAGRVHVLRGEIRHQAVEAGARTGTDDEAGAGRKTVGYGQRERAVCRRRRRRDIGPDLFAAAVDFNEPHRRSAHGLRTRQGRDRATA